ncbi:MAG TPA: hypothetical protein VJW20_18900 [Candidatus Angelobacter sp.]|nr:hypothetical protein [Candidatus Angelobacter sp.]
MSLLKFFLDHAPVVSAFVAVLSLVFTASALYIQRAHFRRSVRPIASIPVADYEDRVGVMLKNKGIGPLHVLQFQATDGKKTENNLISWMPKLPAGISWETFYEDLDGLWIQPGEKVIVLQLAGDVDSPSFSQGRDLCRKALAKLTISIEYEDIYEKRMPTSKRDLAWFGRHFENH